MSQKVIIEIDDEIAKEFDRIANERRGIVKKSAPSYYAGFD